MFFGLFRKKKQPPLKQTTPNITQSAPQASPQSAQKPQAIQAPQMEAYIEDLSRQKQAESDQLFHARQEIQNDFDPYAVAPSDTDCKLTSVEQQFLKKIAGQPVEDPYVAGYWEYEYHLHFPDIMTKLLSNGYLAISSAAQSPEYLTIPELKAILKEHNLPVSGKKSVLIARIRDNIPPDAFSSRIGQHKAHYVLTEKGEALASGAPASITKDPAFEDACLALIHEGKFQAAYKKIAAREAGKTFPRGLRVDWGKYAQQDAAEPAGLYDSGIADDVSGIEKTYRECLILADMLGVSHPAPLIKRVCGSFDMDLFLQARYELQKIKSLCDLDTYRNLDTQYYEILTAGDKEACPRCRKMNGKKYPVSEAEVGVNFPPFCKKCRCTTAPAYEEL